ncbi:MAG: GDSL family lipase, partial [Deltaproteobacteria bacterium]|nr:GDSL family lipase [Deltaproteobacteria bacterium]
MDHPHMIALGDSITYGYPFGHRYSWVELVSQKLGFPIINSGVNGDTFRDMGNRLPFDILDQTPDYVILMGGANDVYQGSPTELIEERLEAILINLADHKIQPILGLPTPINETGLEKKLHKLRTFMKSLAKKKKWPIIDFHSSFIDSKKKKPKLHLLEDGVHPSVEGYQVMAEVALKSLQ